MSHGLDLPQGGFRAPRVPLDLRCVAIGALGYLVVRGVDWGLQSFLQTDTSPVAQLMDLIASQLDYVAFLGSSFRRAMHAVWGVEPYALSFWPTVLVAAVFLAIWSFFGGAMLRTAGLKLTRDDPLSLRDAFSFGLRNAYAFLLAPLLILAFAAFFAGCNALAGLVMSVWGVGSTVLALPLFPLVLVSSLLIVLALMGGIVGLPLMWAGIAIEQNGPLEALSRAFSYIFARPFRFFFSYFLLFVVMSILLLAAEHFEHAVKETTKLGVWRESFDDLISRSPSEPDVLKDEYKNTDRVRREQEGIANIENIWRAPWYDWVGFGWMWLCLSLFLLGFKGYALYLFLGGTTSLYLHLRRDVDGTDEEEIYPESEEEGGGAEPRWVAEGAAPGAAGEPSGAP